MRGFLASSVLSAVACAFPTAATADVPPEERTTIDRIIGGKGAYSADDGAYKVVLPREAATFFQNFQTLSPNLGLNSWVTFSSAVHQESILAGQFLLLEDEVNPVLTVALEAGLEVSALARSSVFYALQMHTLDVSGRGRSEIWPQRFAKASKRFVGFGGTLHRGELDGDGRPYQLKAQSMADRLTPCSR